VPISRAEKRTVLKKASARGLSMAEFARRALLRYDPTEERDAEEAQLRALVEAFSAPCRGAGAARPHRRRARRGDRPARGDAPKGRAVSVLGEALASIKSIVLIEEWVKSQSARLERLAELVTDLDRRVVRIETAMELAIGGRPTLPRRKDD
jgi:hypothetical protein